MPEEEYFDKMKSPNSRRQGSVVTPSKAIYLRTAGGYQVMSPERGRGSMMFSPANRNTITSPKAVPEAN